MTLAKQQACIGDAYSTQMPLTWVIACYTFSSLIGSFSTRILDGLTKSLVLRPPNADTIAFQHGCIRCELTILNSHIQDYMYHCNVQLRELG